MVYGVKGPPRARWRRNLWSAVFGLRYPWQIIALVLIGSSIGPCQLPTAIDLWCRESMLAWGATAA
eukprot:8305398-Lingulodinium_polyedra.AAC.1